MTRATVRPRSTTCLSATLVIELLGLRELTGVDHRGGPQYFVGGKLGYLRYFVGRGHDFAGGSLDSELLHAAPKSVGMEIEHKGGAIRSLNHPTRLFEHVEDMPALNVLKSGGRIGR